jgi:hypothetical protein
MTSQAHECLVYKGEEIGIEEEPLEQYFSGLKKRPKLIAPHTALWRGYHGVWEIKDEKLFLTELVGFVKDNAEVDINYIFPGKKEVFAEWYTGEIRIPQGTILKRMTMDHDAVHEEDLFLEFENGVIINSRIIHNKNLPNNENPFSFLSY